MKLIMRNMNLFGKCGIYDEQNNLLYIVKRNTIGKNHRIYDKSGVEIALVKKVFIGAIHSYYINGNKITDLVRIRELKNCDRYMLTDCDWIIERNLIYSKFKVSNNNRIIMEMCSCNLLSLDVCEINVYDEDNVLMCIMIAISFYLMFS